MKTFREILQKAESDGVAIGHFNVADFTMIKAVFNAAHELRVPVVVGASEGERKFFGTRQLAALVKSFRDEFGWPIFLNADHTHSLPSALEAVNAGFDCVVSIYPPCHLKRTSDRQRKPSKRSSPSTRRFWSKARSAISEPVRKFIRT